MTDPGTLELQRQEAWKRAIASFGTHYIFRKRYARYRTGLRLVAFLGVLVPLVVGGVVLGFGPESPALPQVLRGAAVVALVQIVISAWSLVAKWDDALGHAAESMTTNVNLSARYRQLAQAPPADFLVQLAILDPEYRALERSDEMQVVTDKERRRGMRAALREFQRPCATCKIVPVSMKASNCDTCGNF